MKINLITETKDWIISRCVKEILKLNGEYDFKINDLQNNADLDYFITYDKCEKLITGKSKKAAFFTHFESENEDKATRWINCARACDYLVAMSSSAHTEIKRTNLLPLNKKICLIQPGTDLSKKIVFGVCGKPYSSGRKNEHFIKQLSKEGFNFISWGSDKWGCWNLEVPHSEINKFYEQIDYLVIPSGVEGGPMPILEALALGVPVIAPNVGWCWEYPCIKYEINNIESLRGVLNKLTDAPTWEQWTAKHKVLFEFIKNEKN